MKEKIRNIVAKKLTDMGTRNVSFLVEYPNNIEHGDFTVNAALVVAKTIGKKPREIASEIAGALKDALGEEVLSVEVVGAGFVNIKLSQSVVLGMLEKTIAEGNSWGKNNLRSGERVIIEYGNPNPFKEMHIGHLMGAVIGEALSRLIENSGAKLARDTFGGDVGPHVAKAIWGLQHMNITEPSSAKEIGRAYTHGSRAYSESETAKSEIDDLNVLLYKIVAESKNSKELSSNTRELFDMWRIGRAVSMEAFERLYKIIGTIFDYTFFDSDTIETGTDVVREGLKKGIFEESNGAVIYRGEKKGLHTLVFITSHGTPTYETKDMGLAFIKEERFPSDSSIIITANEQVGHFNVVLSALEDVAPLLAKKTVHIPHGFLRLSTGKMSSREGTVITASELLKDVILRASKKNPDLIVAEQVAVGAIKYMVLRQSPGADIIFDPDKSLSLEGDSGPYLQYALVRALSVLRTAGEKLDVVDEPILTQDAPETPYEIARLIVRFPGTIERAEKLFAPNMLVTYLTELASAWNSFYAKERIVGGEYEAHKISLARAFAQTMKNGLTVLGIPVPEKM